MDYSEKYLKYKTKYLQLKDLIAGSRKGFYAKKTEEVTKKKKETELMTYIKEGDVNISVLSREYIRYQDQKNIFDNDNNLPLYVYIENTETKDIDISIIDFLLPDDTTALSKKNSDGDTIMHLVVKKNDCNLLEKLWTYGGRNVRDVTDKNGYNLLKLAERLAGKNTGYDKVVRLLKGVYANDEDTDALYKGKEERRKRIEASGGIGYTTGRQEDSDSYLSEGSEGAKVEAVDKKISKISSGELLAQYNDDYAKLKEFFVFGKDELEEKLEKGIQFESVYVEPDEIANVPKSPNIFSIKKIPMTSGLLKEISNNYNGIISLVAVQSREYFDTL